MICKDDHLLPFQIVLPLIKGFADCRELLVIWWQGFDGSWQCMGGVCHWTKPIRIFLHEDSSYIVVTGITMYDIRLSRIWLS